MTTEQLNFYAAWASILSLLISIVSLLLIGSVRHNLIGLRRRQRLKTVIEDVLALIDKANVSSQQKRYKLNALANNLPAHVWFANSAEGRALLEVKRHIETGDLLALREALADWNCFVEVL